MFRMAGLFSTVDMSRVERNQYIYEENEAYSRRSGSRTAGKALAAAGFALIILVTATCLLLIVPRIAGCNAYVVVSGSMEPTIPVGSLVYSKQEDPAQMSVGDVIVFIDENRGSTPITHRIVTNNTVAHVITTKGDANDGVDIDPVTYDNVLGRVVAHVPRLGFTAAMLTSFIGKIVAVLLLVEGWLLIEIGRRMLPPLKS